ncbi:MAG: hypothetical protein ACK583_02375 [Cyanobacteriota bacterium]
MRQERRKTSWAPQPGEDQDQGVPQGIGVGLLRSPPTGASRLDRLVLFTPRCPALHLSLPDPGSEDPRALFLECIPSI